jgi:murein DD-endopeptidase MepM/ murein hydrolase activator NlpD
VGAAERKRGLIGPTAKLGAAVAIASALGIAAGVALGLPTPLVEHSSGAVPVARESFFPLSAGTEKVPLQGPFQPVLGKYEYGTGAGRFGAGRYGRSHEGQDVFGKVGTPLIAVRDGVVVDEEPESGAYSGGRGNYIAIYNAADKRSYVYLHMKHRSPFRTGDSVKAGQVLGHLGCTGSCDGPHLHFEIRIGKATLHGVADTKAINPLPELRRWPRLPQ